jgi:hypothetical protein
VVHTAVEREVFDLVAAAPQQVLPRLFRGDGLVAVAVERALAEIVVEARGLGGVALAQAAPVALLDRRRRPGNVEVVNVGRALLQAVDALFMSTISDARRSDRRR